MCTAFHFAHKLFSKHELVSVIEWVLSFKGNLSARDPKLLFYVSGGKKTSSGGRGEGSQIKEVNNEVKVNVGGSGV